MISTTSSSELMNNLNNYNDISDDEINKKKQLN